MLAETQGCRHDDLLRPAYLYRELAHASATILTILHPSPCRRPGWHVLMRARVETGCFVFAPAQVGTHKV